MQNPGRCYILFLFVFDSFEVCFSNERNRNIKSPATGYKEVKTETSMTNLHAAAVHSPDVCTREDYEAKQREMCRSENWILLWGHCIWFSRSSEMITWANAKETCRWRGYGRLALIPSFLFLKRVMGLYAGRPNPGAEPGALRWVDGTLLRKTVKGFRAHKYKHMKNACVGMTQSNWYDKECDTKLSFVCQAKTGPRIYERPVELQRENPLHKLAIGSEMTVRCISTSSIERPLCAELIKGNISAPRACSDNTTKSLVVKSNMTEYRYVRESGHCVRQTIYRVTIVVTSYFKSRRLGCCNHADAYEVSSGRQPRCALEETEFETYYTARKPQLQTNFEGKGAPVSLEQGRWANCRCTAFLGDTDVMTVALFTRYTLGNWSATVDIHRHVQDNNPRPEGVELEKLQVYWDDDELGGNVVFATMAIQINGEYEGAVCACFSYNATPEIRSRDPRHGNATLRTFSAKMSVLFLPQKPVMNVDYYDGLSAVYHGQWLNATCQARIGSRGSLTWIIRTTELSLTCEKRIGMEPESIPEGVVMTQESVEHPGSGPYNGPERKSEFSIRADKSLDAAWLECHSLDAFYNEESNPPDENHFTRSNAISVKYKKRPPRLHTDYFRRADRDVVMKSRCSAHVGSDGILAWGVELSNSSVELLEIAVSGKVYRIRNALAVTVKRVSVVNDSETGPHITGEFWLLLSHLMQGATLVCSSHSLNASLLSHGAHTDGFKVEKRIEYESTVFTGESSIFVRSFVMSLTLVVIWVGILVALPSPRLKEQQSDVCIQKDNDDGPIPHTPQSELTDDATYDGLEEDRDPPPDHGTQAECPSTPANTAVDPVVPEWSRFRSVFKTFSGFRKSGDEQK